MSLMLGVIVIEHDPLLPGGPFDIKARSHPAIEICTIDNLETIVRYGGYERCLSDDRWRTIMPIVMDGKLVHIVVRECE